MERDQGDSYADFYEVIGHDIETPAHKRFSFGRPRPRQENVAGKRAPADYSQVRGLTAAKHAK